MDATHSQGDFKVPARTYLLWIAIIGLISLLLILRNQASSEGPLLSQHESMRLVENDQIVAAKINIDPQTPRSYDVRGDHFKVNSNVKVPFRARVYLTDQCLQELLNIPAFHATRPNTLLMNVVWSLGPILLVALLIYFVLIRQLKSAVPPKRAVQPGSPSPFAGIIEIAPDIVQRAPVFVGTDVPLQRLIDALERGDSIEKFLGDHPSVKRSQVLP